MFFLFRRFDRARIICSNDNQFTKEKTLLKNVLNANNYPAEFVNKEIKNIEKGSLLIPHNNNNRNNSANIICKNLTTPYVKGLSERIKKIGNQSNIRTSFKSNNTLRSILTKTKPKNEEQSSKNCIYQISCECDKFYLGETSRPLKVRINEHKKYIKDREFFKSGICKHAWEEGHKIQWDSTKIILKEPNNKRRKIKESALIQLNSDKCVASISAECSQIWLPMLEREISNNQLPALSG
jgi:predicted GIY-YIG superfamily endonuclease